MYNPIKHKPPILVLGMHRSGTSCLAGTLEEAGVYLGEVYRWNPYNKKGNRENKDIMRLHNDILAANGGSWIAPPESGEITWSPEHKSARDEIIAQYAKFGWWRTKNAYWGFKDPRTLLVLEGWLEALPDARAVGIFRHPTSVVRSLQNRNSGLSDQDGFYMWWCYNSKLLDYQQSMGFPLVCFDLSDDELKAKFLLVLSRLGMDRDELAFFDPGLRSGWDETLTLPDDVASLYERLKELAI